MESKPYNLKLMILHDVKLMVCNRGKYKDISIRFQCKSEDYSMEQYEELCDQAIDGTCGVLVWQPFGEKIKTILKQNDDNQTTESKELSPHKTNSSRYSRFKLDVERDFGVEAYRKLKERLKIDHLKDLELTHSTAEIDILLQEELCQLRQQAGFYDQI